MDNEPPARLHVFLRSLKWETRNFLGVALNVLFQKAFGSNSSDQTIDY